MNYKESMELEPKEEFVTELETMLQMLARIAESNGAYAEVQSVNIRNTRQGIVLSVTTKRSLFVKR